MEGPVDISGRIVGGRRIDGPKGDALPGRLERGHDLQEPIREPRVHDDEGMDVRRDRGVVGQNIKEARSVSVLPRAGRWSSRKAMTNGRQVSLRRTLVIVDQQTTETSIEALVLP
jgi:hypothetical protein